MFYVDSALCMRGVLVEYKRHNSQVSAIIILRLGVLATADWPIGRMAAGGPTDCPQTPCPQTVWLYNNR